MEAFESHGIEGRQGDGVDNARERVGTIIGIVTPGGERLHLRREGAGDGAGDGDRRIVAMDHRGAGDASALTDADVDRRYAGRGDLDETARGIADDSTDQSEGRMVATASERRNDSRRTGGSRGDIRAQKLVDTRAAGVVVGIGKEETETERAAGLIEGIGQGRDAGVDRSVVERRGVIGDDGRGAVDGQTGESLKVLTADGIGEVAEIGDPERI